MSVQSQDLAAAWKADRETPARHDGEPEDPVSQTLSIDNSDLFEVIGERYRLVRGVGRGRLGPVFEAQDAQSPGSERATRLAVQLVQNRLASNSELVKRLRRGVDSLLSSRHPNVVDVLELGRSGRTLFLAMSWLDGAPLRDVLNLTPKLPPDEVDTIVRGIGDGLAYLHAKGIAHGQLTPASVFVTSKLQIQLIDLMPLHSVTGSDNQSQDIFSLACLTYQLLAGRHPYNSNTAEEATRSGLEAARIDRLGDQRWSALARALSLDPESRPDSVGEFLREFGVPEVGTPLDSISLVGMDDATPPDEQTTGDLIEAHTADIVRPVPDIDEPEDGLSASSERVDTGIDESVLAERVEIIPPLEVTPRIAARSKPGGRAGARLLAIACLAPVAILGWSTLGQLPPPDAAESSAVIPEPDTAMIATSVAEATDTGSAVAAEQSAFAAIREPEAPAASDASNAPEETPAELAAEPPAESAAEPAEQPLAESPTEPAASQNLASAPAAVPEPAALRWPASPISVSESAAYARVEIRRTGNLATPAEFLWWTVPLDAIADEDYLDLGQRTERFAAQEETRVLLVPLVNDGLTEAAKRFEIRLQSEVFGIDEETGDASIQIEIVDDD